MNSIIDINLREEENSFVLRGDIQSLLKKRRAMIFLVDYLHAVKKENEIIIIYDETEKEETLQDIRDLLNKFQFIENPSEIVKQQLSDYFQEEKNFKVFSEQAKLIRNDELTPKHMKEFKDFSEILLREMPKRSLYPLQLLSAYHLAYSQNSCNFSVPGSGKTSIVYGAFAYLNNLEEQNPKKVDRLIIIGPLSSFGPWEDEYIKCFGKRPNSKRMSGGISKDEKIAYFYSSSSAKITLFSYNSIPNIVDELIYYLKKYKCMIVLDEAHKIKNTDGGVFATATLKLAKYAKARVVLTGTPAPNGYEDLYNLFKFIWPSYDVLGYHVYQLKDMSSSGDDERIGRLVKNISPYFMRIRKSDLHLPEPINHPPIFVEMDETQAEVYDYIERNYMDYFISHGGNSDLHSILVRARLIRLMQVSTNPSLLEKSLDEYFIMEGYSNNTFIDDAEIINKIVNYKEFKVPKKFIKAGELIKNIIAKKEKVIVWATFIQNLHEFADYLKNIGIESRLLYGATPIESDEDEDVETREKIIRQFHRNDCPYKVLIANPFAISESISLHKACQNAIYLEKTFNAANFVQSKDRIHRVGLTNTVNYYYLLSDNNIDRTIHQRLLEKERRMLAIIENEPIPLFNRILDEDDDDLKTLIDNYVNHSN